MQRLTSRRRGRRVLGIQTALWLFGVLSFGHAVTIPTGDVDLTVIAQSQASLDSVRLVKWRTGTPNHIETSGITNLTFAYLAPGGTVAFPTRESVGDNSANDQGDLWSDNALEVNFHKGTRLDQAILIYTANQPQGPADPLTNIEYKGGMVGGAGCSPSDVCYAGRVSLLLLYWKAMTRFDLEAVSSARPRTPSVGAQPIPDTSPMFMPSRTQDVPYACPSEGPYPASTRPANYLIGFCDYATHFFTDKFNSNPNGLFYDQYPPTVAARRNAFQYSSLVGPYGINTTEGGGGGGGSQSPMYAVLGLNLGDAVQTKYGTTIHVELLSL